jgi:hypothetical protein
MVSKLGAVHEEVGRAVLGATRVRNPHVDICREIESLLHIHEPKGYVARTLRHHDFYNLLCCHFLAPAILNP